jgi:hypothetical protein
MAALWLPPSLKLVAGGDGRAWQLLACGLGIVGDYLGHGAPDRLLYIYVIIRLTRLDLSASGNIIDLGKERLCSCM